MNTSRVTLCGPRGTRRRELESLVELVDEVFCGRDGIQESMFTRYPTLFALENLSNCRIVTDGKRPVAHVGYVVRDARIQEATIRLAHIGAVCTLEAYRGRGLASRLLDDCAQRMRKQSVDVVCISGARGLYLRWGARTVGKHVRYLLDKRAVGRLRDRSVAIRLGGLRQASVLARLYDSKPVRYLRSMDDWRLHLRCCNCENQYSVPLIAYRGTVPVAYVVCKHTSHIRAPISKAGEWAGEPGYVLAVFAEVPQLCEREDVEIVLDQIADAPLVAMLSAKGFEATTQGTGRTVKVLRPAVLFRKLRPILPDAARELQVIEGNSGARFQRGRTVLDLPAEMVARAFFGAPENELDAVLGRAGELGALMREVFPVPLPRYGYNYI